jgi:beta-lactam-binding protein with PASTA domain
VIAYETPAIQQRQICAQHPSQCPLRTKMPRLIGLSTGEAQTEIGDVLGFPVSIVRAASSAPPGTVVAQNPNPRTPIKGRIRVTLTVSTG